MSQAEILQGRSVIKRLTARMLKDHQTTMGKKCHTHPWWPYYVNTADSREYTKIKLVLIKKGVMKNQEKLFPVKVGYKKRLL